MRQAVSPVISTIVLIGMALGIAVIVSSYYLGINHDSISCDILSAELFQITTSKHWGMIQFWNDGDYSVSEYSIILLDGTQDTLVKTVNGVNISPGDMITEEFEINHTLQSDEIILQVEIQNDPSESMCGRVIKL